jgi:Cu+-exporting ATPase
LQQRFSLSVLSGDHAKEKAKLNSIFPQEANIHFNQKPEEKLNQIRELQKNGDSVMMIGDGLNDAGALRGSDFGVAITDDITAFTPASDAILQGNQLQHLNRMLRFTNQSKTILKGAFILSFLYNIVGLSFAATGHLTPIFAAILMPLSSITVVIFSTLSVKLMARLHFNRRGKAHCVDPPPTLESK